MSRCIYCLLEFGVVQSGSTVVEPSLEHIVPWAIGGSNACATKEVCVDCNSLLGQTVDARFINQPLIAMMRQKFGISGYTGKVPDVVLEARSTNGDEPARITIPHEGDVTIHHKPVVVRQDDSRGEQILVAGLDEDVRRIVTGILGKGGAEGKQLLDPETGAVTDLESSIAAAPREIYSEYGNHLTIEFHTFYQELIKVAFGFGHLALGWKWTLSDDADRLRQLILAQPNPEEIMSSVKGIDLGIRAILPPDFSDQDSHLLCLMPGEETFAIVSLFGESWLSAAVPISIEPQVLEAASLNGLPAIISINPVARTTRTLTLLEFSTFLAERAIG